MPFHFYLFLGPEIKNSSIWASLLDPFLDPFRTLVFKIPVFSNLLWFPNSRVYKIPVASRKPL